MLEYGEIYDTIEYIIASSVDLSKENRVDLTDHITKEILELQEAKENENV